MKEIMRHYSQLIALLLAVIVIFSGTGFPVHAEELAVLAENVQVSHIKEGQDGDLWKNKEDDYPGGLDLEALGAEIESSLPYVIINESNFPDEALRNYLSENFGEDLEGVGRVIYLIKDGSPVLLTLDCTDLGVTSLKGIELLKTLVSLTCSENGISDFSNLNNENLRYLNCAGNSLTSLDVSRLPALQYLLCQNNSLTELDLSHNPALVRVNCSNNKLSTLDLTANTSLDQLNASGNQLTSIDLSACKALTQLNISKNQLKSVDLSACTGLLKLNASVNQFMSLDLTALTELSELDVHSNQLTALDISKCKKLSVFVCTFNAISLLDFRGNTTLNPFSLTSLNVAFQTGELAIVCDQGSEMERYCQIYLIPYVYSILDARPTVSTTKAYQVVALKEKADLSLIFSSLTGGKEIKKYTVSPKGYASINKKGIFKGKKVGQVLVTAYTGSGSSATAVATYPVEIVKPAFSKKKVECVSINEVVFGCDYLTGINYRPDSWLSSNENVAEVNPALGKIVVKKRGNAKITALYGTGKNAAKITFKISVKIPKISRTQTYLKLGKSSKLKLLKTKKKPVWKSMDSSVVAIDAASGQMTGVGLGTTRVIAYLDAGTSGQTEYECKVTVVK
ncbi:MAG: hypothetical protein K5989_12225 [Lachnospiraceae bacterium]|nr:hypothetical protein [Lachnospiraceae bacterium]